MVKRYGKYSLLIQAPYVTLWDYDRMIYQRKDGKFYILDSHRERRLVTFIDGYFLLKLTVEGEAARREARYARQAARDEKEYNERL